MSNLIDMDKTYKTRDGRAVRILCVDLNKSVEGTYPVVAAVTSDCGVERIALFYIDGAAREGSGMDAWSCNDLVEHSFWNDVAVDTKILVRDNAGSDGSGDFWQPAHFAKYENGVVYAWADRATSHTEVLAWHWQHAKLAIAFANE